MKVDDKRAAKMKQQAAFGPMHGGAVLDLLADRETLVQALAWALSELPSPTVYSDPEYGLHHQAARAALEKEERS